MELCRRTDSHKSSLSQQILVDGGFKERPKLRHCGTAGLRQNHVASTFGPHPGARKSRLQLIPALLFLRDCAAAISANPEVRLAEFSRNLSRTYRRPPAGSIVT